MTAVRPRPEFTDLLTPAEVSRTFGVDPKTVTRWDREGRLASIRTPGGQRRYDAKQIRDLVAVPDARPGEMLTPTEVSRAFGVDPKTVTRWAKQGRLRCVWTPGGHRRYLAADVRAFLNGRAGDR